MLFRSDEISIIEYSDKWYDYASSISSLNVKSIEEIDIYLDEDDTSNLFLTNMDNSIVWTIASDDDTYHYMIEKIESLYVNLKRLTEIERKKALEITFAKEK